VVRSIASVGRARMGGGWSRRTRGNRRSKSRRRICLRRGIDEAVPPALVSADGTFSAGGYSWAPPLNAASRCSNYLLAKRLSRGPRASRRPAAATKSYECSGSIPLLKVDGTSNSSSRGTVEPRSPPIIEATVNSLPNQPVKRMAAGRTVWQFREVFAAAIAHSFR
jgi:hypothetical protein